MSKKYSKGYASRLIKARAKVKALKLYVDIVKQGIKEEGNNISHYIKNWHLSDKVVYSKRHKAHVTLNIFGYVLIKVGGNLIMEHLHVSSQEKEIPRGYHVHHCNLDKLDNRVENLAQIPGELHRLIHAAFKNVKKNMPSKDRIISSYLPDFFAGHNRSLRSDRAAQVSARQENRKPRVPKINKDGEIPELKQLDPLPKIILRKKKVAVNQKELPTKRGAKPFTSLT